MRISKHFMALMSLAISLIAVAEPITESQARSIAAQFLAGQNTRPMTLRRAATHTTAAPDSHAAYYIFNTGGPSDGYVIIAGDDQAIPVLGYSDAGSFDNDNVPPAMQEMLDGYAAQIAAMQEGAIAAPSISRVAISPLVNAQWNQRQPYNILLPKINGERVLAGCVAIAMAQVMHYWQWPASIDGPIPPYTSKTNGINMGELPATSFNWSMMQNSYLTSDTLSGNSTAVAKLVLYCAQALKMDFGTNASSAYTPDIVYLLSEYFGYHSGIHTISREGYTAQGWEDAIYAELAENRPVILSGRKRSGGHAFVCDGCDQYGLFHINWGWNGQSNGYFALNVLNPDLQGTGSATGSEGYILNQLAVVGIKPGTGGTHTLNLTARDLKMTDYTQNRTATNESFTATLSASLHNFTGQPLQGNYAWGRFNKSNNALVEVIGQYNCNLSPNYYYSLVDKVVSFGSGITSGSFKIMPIYRKNASSDWEPCQGGNHNYIEVTISGNHCNFKGYGSAAISDYSVNQITVNGTLHQSRPVDIILNLTNTGDSDHDVIYMFANSSQAGVEYQSVGIADIEPGQSGDVVFRFMPQTTGYYDVTFSLKEDGSDPLGYRTISITAMPAADLSGSIQALNVTDNVNNVITSDKFCVDLTVTNNSRTSTYREDISMILYKHVYDNSGTTVQAKSQYLELGPRQTTTVHFEFDNVSDGWRYFTMGAYYSNGTRKGFCYSPFYTINVPNVPPHVPGDVNGDGEVSIADINSIIDVMLGNGTNPAADVNNDHEITISDINMVIDYIMKQ